MWGPFCDNEFDLIVNCDYCGCCLNDLDDDYVVGTTCRDCYEIFEAEFEKKKSEVESNE